MGEVVVVSQHNTRRGEVAGLNYTSGFTEPQNMSNLGLRKKNASPIKYEIQDIVHAQRLEPQTGIPTQMRDHASRCSLSSSR